MARTGKWPARISLALSAAMIAALFSVITASGQQSTAAGLPTIGIEVQSGSITQATYALVVRNQGTAPTTGTLVRSAVPVNTTFESSEPAPSATTSPGTGATSCDNGGTREPEGTVCQWDIGTLAPGETRTITATYNLNQTNIASYRVTHNATVRDNEGHENSDSDTSLVRQRVDITDDAWVDDAEPAGTNHGACNFLRVLQGNRVTSYVDADSLGTPPTSGEATQTMETLYGAQLRAEVLDTTYSAAAPGVIGAHRITSGEWTEGSGTCQGAVSSTATDARTGGEPVSAQAPTGTTSISAAAQVVNWDVTADLDSEQDRGSFQGWELRDQAATGTDNSTRFHSKEAAETAQDPRIFLVYKTFESATCIDVDPEAQTTAAGTEHLLTVFVTDGAKTPAPGNAPGSGTGPGGDACNGGPVATPVEWEIEDDSPDIYFSSQEGVAIPKTISNNNATPNTIETTADVDGVTGAGVRLSEATVGSDATNRIEARIKGATDPDPRPNPTVPVPPPNPCTGPTPPPAGVNCSGEAQQVDDASVTWASSSGSPGQSASTTSGSPTSASPSSGSPTSPSPSGSTSGSPSGTPSSPSGSASSSSPSISTRTISLFASANEVVYPAEVTLSGQITSSDESCENAGEFVRIQRRILGESQYSDFESENTDADGRYDVTVPATESAEYVATAPAHDNCANASSSSETVLVKVKITGRSGRRSVERGSRVGIVGRVQPDHDGTTVVLQRRKGGRFVRVARDELNVRSRYRFVVTANWRGRRVFRVVWNGQDEDHASNSSNNIVIRARR